MKVQQTMQSGNVRTSDTNSKSGMFAYLQNMMHVTSTDAVSRGMTGTPVITKWSMYYPNNNFIVMPKKAIRIFLQANTPVTHDKVKKLINEMFPGPTFEVVYNAKQEVNMWASSIVIKYKGLIVLTGRSKLCVTKQGSEADAAMTMLAYVLGEDLLVINDTKNYKGLVNERYATQRYRVEYLTEAVPGGFVCTAAVFPKDIPGHPLAHAVGEKRANKAMAEQSAAYKLLDTKAFCANNDVLDPISTWLKYFKEEEPTLPSGMHPQSKGLVDEFSDIIKQKNKEPKIHKTMGSVLFAHNNNHRRPKSENDVVVKYNKVDKHLVDQVLSSKQKKVNYGSTSPGELKSKLRRRMEAIKGKRDAFEKRLNEKRKHPIFDDDMHPQGKDSWIATFLGHLNPISKANESISGAADSGKKLMDELSTALRTLSGEAKEMMKKVTDTLVTTAHNWTSILPKVTIVALVICAVCLFWNGWMKTASAISVVALALCVGQAEITRVLTYIRDAVPKYQNEIKTKDNDQVKKEWTDHFRILEGDPISKLEPGAKLQMNVDSIKETTSKWVVALLGTAIIGKEAASMNLTKLGTAIGHWPNFYKGVNEIIPWAIDTIINCVNTIRVSLGFDEISTLDSETIKYEAWIKSCHSYLLKVSQNTKIDQNDLESISRLTFEGMHYMHKLKMIPKSDRAKMSISNVINSLQKVLDKNKHLLDKSVGARPMPIAILLTGLPGVGKSGLIYRFVAAILCQILSVEELERFKTDPEAFIYNREFENKFWDAYHQQPVCVWDDFGQSADVAAADNEWMDILRCSNIFAHVCHMAALEMKGNVIFNSPILLATSNSAVPNTNLLTCKPALWRRFAFKVKVVVKPQYSKPGDKGQPDMLDTTKMSLEAPDFMGAWDFLPYEIDQHGVLTMTGEKLSFEELVGRVNAKYDQMTKFHKRFKEGTEMMITKLLERRKDVPKPQGKFSDPSELKEFDHDDISFYKTIGSCPSYNMCFSDRLVQRMADKITNQTWVWSKECADDGTNELYLMRCLVYNLIEQEKAEEGTTSMFKVVLARNLLWHVMGNPNAFKILAMIYNKIDRPTEPFDHKAILGDMFKFEEKIEVQSKDIEANVEFDKFCKAWPDIVKHFSYDVTVMLYSQHKEMLLSLCVTEPDATAERNRHVLDWLASQYRTSGLEPEVDAQISIAKSYKTIFKSWSEWVAVKLSAAWTFFKKHWKMVATILGSIALLIGVIFYAISGIPGEYVAQSSEFSKRDNYERRGKYRKTNRKSELARRDAHAQSNSLPKGMNTQHREALNILNSVWANNVYVISELQGGEPMLYAIGLKDRMFLTNKHITGLIKKKDLKHLWIRLVRGGIDKQFLTSDILESPDYNSNNKTDDDSLIFCIKSTTFKQCPDITEKFMSETAAKNSDRFPAWLRVLDGDEPVTTHIQYVWYDGTPYEYSDGRTDYLIPHLWGYSHAFTKDGDCGSPLILDVKGCHVIGGIHCIGSSKLGAAQPVFRENLKKRLTAFASPHTRGTHLNVETKAPEFKVQAHDIDAVQVVVDEVPRYNVTRKSKLKKTPVHGKFGPGVKAPAILDVVEREGHVVDPMARNFLSKADSLPPLDRGMMCDIASEIICTTPIDVNDPWFQGDYKRTLTYEEAVEGIKGMPEWKGIDRSTCPGIPYLYDNKEGGKRKWLGREGDYCFNSTHAQQLREDVMKMDAALKRGERPTTCFATFEKDELRKLDKIAAINTRDINADNLAKIIEVRRYFGAFMIFTTKTRIRNGTAIGVNPYSGEWEIMYRRLRSMLDDEPVDGDVAKWDKKLHPSAIYGFFVGVCNWYGPNHPDNVARMALGEEFLSAYICLFPGKLPKWARDKLVNSELLTREELVALTLDEQKQALVIMQEVGFPSGHVLTALLNSWLGVILNCTGFGVTISKTHELDRSMWVTEWRQHVVYVGLGDDNIWTCSQKWKSEFNAITYTAFLETIGMGYTTADKQKWVTRGNSWDKVEFLKRGFFKIDGHVEAPLSLDSIRESCYWTRVDDNWNTARLVFQNALGELALHGEEVYDKLAPAMIDAYTKSYGVGLPRISWRMNLRFIKSEVRLAGID